MRAALTVVILAAACSSPVESPLARLGIDPAEVTIVRDRFGVQESGQAPRIGVGGGVHDLERGLGLRLGRPLDESLGVGRHLNDREIAEIADDRARQLHFVDTACDRRIDG